MKPLTLEYVIELFDKEHYVVLDTEYKNNSKPVHYRCPNGHFGKISMTSWKAGGRCAKCAKNAKMTIAEVSESFEKEGYTLLSKDYINAHTKLAYICPNGHKHSITWSNWNHKNKFRCPKCSNRISKQEVELHVLLTSWGIDFMSNCRNVLLNPETNRYLELDIWIPNLKKAIEFNGEYWHSKAERVVLDRIKEKLCIEKRISLIIIYYKDWINNKDNEKTRLYNFIFKG